MSYPGLPLDRVTCIAGNRTPTKYSLSRLTATAPSKREPLVPLSEGDVSAADRGS